MACPGAAAENPVLPEEAQSKSAAGAEESVEGMKQELIALQPKLVEKNKEAGRL